MEGYAVAQATTGKSWFFGSTHETKFNSQFRSKQVLHNKIKEFGMNHLLITRSQNQTLVNKMSAVGTEIAERKQKQNLTFEKDFLRRLEDKVAVITGGASGIGEGTARLFARHGAKIIIADIQDDLGHSVCKEIESESGQPVTYVHCDVTSDSDVENAVNTAISTYGKLDIMFNNAGTTGNYDPRISSLDREDFKRVFDINVYGAFLGAKHAAKVMIPEKKGCILFTSSVAAVSSGGTPHPYTASKHAVVGLTKNLCVELGPYGIRVNCISPSGIATPLVSKALGGLDLKTVQELAAVSANLKGVMAEANDIAEAALYLGSDEARYVSGLNLVVDGGYSVRTMSFQ